MDQHKMPNARNNGRRGFKPRNGNAIHSIAFKAKCEKNQQPGHAFWSDGFIWQRSKNQTTKEKLRSDAKSRQRKIINRICKNLKRNEKKIAALDHLPDMNLELRLFLCSKDWEPGKIKMQ